MRPFLLSLLLCGVALAKNDFQVCATIPDQGDFCTAYNLSHKDARLVAKYINSFSGYETYVAEKPKSEAHPEPAPKAPSPKKPVLDGTTITIL